MKFKGFLLIILTLIASIYTAFDTTAKYINYTYPTVIAEAKEQVSVTVIENKPINIPTEEKNEESTQETVPVAAQGTALGKIIPEFLSPYNAGDNFGKVYLKNSTGANINIEALLNAKCGFTVEKSTEPQVLIMHTHTTESYILHDSDYYTENDASRSTESDKNMVAVGNAFEKILTDAGIGVIHDTTIHDHPSYTGSYSRSAQTVSADLKAYPSIKVVIDIHRDAITREPDKVKPIAKVNGKNVAQVMLVMGSQTGSVTGHENWQENLKFALKYQEKMEEMYPGLARSLMLRSSKYNQNLTTGSILLEVGSEANTLSEAKAAAELAAKALVELFGTMK